MSAIKPSTLRRLQKLPQIPSVWEGDSRPLGENFPSSLQQHITGEGTCFLWVDGTQGVVRAMDVVPQGEGLEAVVRSLLQAMETPHSSQPGRPQKIVVRDRELQFYLRGVLQDLSIRVDCAGELPLIDEIFDSFEEAATSQGPDLPETYRELLMEKALQIWQDAPWDYLEDHQVIAITLKHWDVSTLYASVMGMLGMEYGVLLYRSLDSLQQFRQEVIHRESAEHLEGAFLRQDCLFLTFSAADPEDDDLDLGLLPAEAVEPNFGTIHPLEGMRPLLAEEEAIALAVALEALHRFTRQHHRTLETEFTTLSSRYRIPNPQIVKAEQKVISVQVETLEHVAERLLQIEADEEEVEADEGETQVVLREDLIPDKSFLALGLLPWTVVDHLRETGQFYPVSNSERQQQGEGLPVVIVRTTRPKAKAMIETLQEAGGPEGICFNVGVDPFSGTRYELEIIRTANGDLHLCGEFLEDDPRHAAARHKWDHRCQKTGGYCGLVVAMGLTSTRQRSKEDLPLKHLLALFELQALAPKAMGLGPMVRMGMDTGFLEELL